MKSLTDEPMTTSQSQNGRIHTLYLTLFTLLVHEDVCVFLTIVFLKELLVHRNLRLI